MRTHADYVELAVRVNIGEPHCFTEHGYVTATQNGHLSFSLCTSLSYVVQSLAVLTSHNAWRNTEELTHADNTAHVYCVMLCVKPTILTPTNQNLFHLFADI